MLNAHILTPLLPLAALAVILTGCRADEPKTRPISKSITTAPVPDDITPAPAEIDAESEKAKQAAQNAEKQAAEKAKKQAAEKAAQKAKKQAAEKAALLAAEKAAQKAAETAAFQSACRDKITAKMPDPSAAKISYTPLSGPVSGAEGYRATVSLKQLSDGGSITLDFTCFKGADGGVVTTLITD